MAEVRWRAARPIDAPLLVDLAWLAGLVEGEGSFYLHNRKDYPSVLFQISMSDEDVIRRAQKVLGGIGSISIKKPGPRSVKPQWQWRVMAQAEVAWVMDLLYPFMGLRRAAKIDELRASLPDWTRRVA